MKTKTTIIICALAAITPLHAKEKSPDPRPKVEVAFVLDSTGSMGGLIEGAKEKIWTIANSIIARDPKPEVRIGILAYRDRGDEYITRMHDLTDDLKKLNEQERKDFIGKQQAKRTELNSQLGQLVQKRDKFIRAENAKLATEGKGDAFDLKVAGLISEQIK